MKSTVSFRWSVTVVVAADLEVVVGAAVDDDVVAFVAATADDVFVAPALEPDTGFSGNAGGGGRGFRSGAGADVVVVSSSLLLFRLPVIISEFKAACGA